MKWTGVSHLALEGKEGEIEVRQLFELADFGSSEAIERFRKLGVAIKQSLGVAVGNTMSVNRIRSMWGRAAAAHGRIRRYSPNGALHTCCVA